MNLSRTLAIRNIVEKATDNYDIYIAGPNASMNVGGSVEYTIMSDLTDRQKEMFCIIAGKWKNVETAYITRTYRPKYLGVAERGRNLRVRFSNRADGSKA